MRPTLPLLVTLVMLTLGVDQAWGGVVVGNVYVTQGKGTVRPDMQVYYAFKGWRDETVGTETSADTLGTIRMDNGSTKRCKFVVVRTNPGYTFDGWYKEDGTKKSGDNPFYDETVTAGVNRTYTYYARFAPNTYTLTFDKNAADATLGTTSSTVTFDDRYDAGTGGWPTPARTGYTFDGWFTSGGVEISRSTAVTTASNHTLYAHWTPIAYSVTLDNEGGSPSSSSVTLTYDSNTHAAITNPTKTNYTFDGWWTGDNGTGSLVIATDGTLQANVSGYTGAGGIWTKTTATTLYAKWILNSKTITLDNQLATTAGTESIEVLYNKNNNLTGIPAITIPEKTNHTFEGYYTAVNGGGVQIIAANGNVNASVEGYTDGDKKWLKETDVTLYAYWKQNQTITWTQDFGSPVRSNVITLSASASSPLGVSYEVTANADKVTLVGNTLTCLKAGTVTVRAYQDGNGSWNATEYSRDITIIEHAITTNPTASGNYEQTLSELAFVGAVTNVEGSWDWENGNIIPLGGTHNYRAIFTPSSSIISAYPLTCDVAVTIATVDPDITRSDVQANYMVDADALDLQALWTTESDGSVTYSKVSFVPSGSNNTGATAPAITENRYLSLGQAGTLTIQMDIAASSNYNARTVTKTITIHKYNSVFTGVANFNNVLVDNPVTSEYVLTYTKPNDAYIGAANHVAGAPTGDGAFHYAVSHTVQTDSTRGSADPTKVIAYNPSTKVATGKNKGVATVTLTQDETYKYNGATTLFNVNVIKRTPVFTWNGNVETNYSFEYYFNSVTNDIFQTTSGREQDTIITTDNEYSAMMLGDSLMVYNVAEVAHITIRQPENYKWNAHEKTYTITPKNYANTLPLTYTESSNASYTTSIVTPSDNEFEWSHTDEIKLIGRGEKYLILHFNDMPDKLYYKFREQSVSGNGTTWYIMESETMETWDTIKIETRSSSEWPANPREVQLSPTTRYVKLCYTGNRDSQYKGIRITKLENFESNPKDSLKFGLQGQNYGQQVMTVNFDHANAGRVTTVAIEGADADKFTVTPNEIAGTGRDLAGSSTLRVSFDNKRTDRNNTRAENVPYVAKLVITDNAGHRDTVNMTGYRHGKSFPQFTFNPNHVPYYYGTTIHNIVVSTNNDTTITVTSSDNSIAEIVDGKLEIKHRNAEVTITVSQPEKGDFRAHTQTFKFTPREEPPLKLPFIMTKTIYDNNKMVISKGEDVSWTDDGYIRSGWSDWQATASGRYFDSKKVFVIEFANAPDKLSFTAKNTYCSINCRWKVEQSSDNVNWSQVFYKEQSCKSDVEFSDIQLDPSTRYLRFQYGGNYTGYFKDINVTCLDGYKYMLTPDNKYLSRGAEWGTQAVVGEFGVPVRVTRSTTDNVNLLTQVQYMDSREFLYEAGDNLVFTDNKTASNNTNIQWKQTVVGGKVKVQSANPGMGSKYISIDENNKLVMTDDAAAATVWEVEDYTIHQARIDAKLDAKAAEAARRDFGAEINTMAKVRTMLQTEEFDSTVVALKPRAISEVKGVYRYEGTTGTKPIFDTVVSGLDTGFYCLTVQAFYRPSASPRDWENHANGMESHPAYVYANDFKFPIKSVFDETGRHSTQFAGDTLCPDGWYPANLASAVNAMSGDANKYKYWHDLYVYVPADADSETGTLRFGVKNPSYVPGTWLVYGNFTLTKLARKMYYFDNEGSQSNIWSTINDWEYKEGRATSTPGEKNAVTIQSNVEVAGEFKVYSLTVDAGKTVTIDPTGGLTIGVGGVSLGDGAQLILKAETEGANKGQTGYIRISPEYEGAMPSASVELFAEAYYPTGGNAVWQMVGAPIANEGVKAKSVYSSSWVYSWDEQKNDWVNRRSKMTFEPFIGFETTQKTQPSGMTVTYNGQLVAGNEVITKNLAFTDASHGYNAMANSFAAPIDISQFTSSDFVNAEATIYILNSGTKAQSEDPGEGVDQPGQWLEIPVASAAEWASTYGKPLTIPSMQGFFVRATTAGAQMKFDYSRLVWGIDYSGLRATKPLRAPQRGETEDAIGSLQVSLYANGEVDHLYFLEAEKYDAAFENGYDAHKMLGAGMNIFSVEGDDHLAVDATNSIIGTRVGVRTGEETAYTIVFSHVNSEDDMMLLDTEADERVEIREGGMYTFFAEPNSEITGRFVIVEAEAQEIATGVEEATTEDAKVHKFIKDDKLFILKNGVLYDATGRRVRQE